MDESALQAELKKYSFYHVIPLTPQLSTPGVGCENEKISVRALASIDVAGKRVLDVGCRDGKFSFQAERAGAAEVIGIDNDLSRAATEFLIPFFKSKTQMVEMNLLDLRPDTFGLFDVVLFFGVLYHLRYPFWSLKILRDTLVPGGLLLIETAVLRDAGAHSLLYCPIGSESPYEDTSCTFFNEKGLCDSLASLGLRVQRVEHLHATPPAPAANPLRLLKSRVRNAVRAALGKTEGPQIGRATFVCCFEAELIDRDVTDYWERIHTLNSPQKREVVWVPSSARGSKADS